MFQVSNLRYFGTIFEGRNEHGRLAACNPELMGSKQLSMAMPLPSHEEYAMGNINDWNIDDFFEDSDHAIDKAASDLANVNPKDVKFHEVLFRRAEVLVDTVLARHVRNSDVTMFKADQESLPRFAETLDV